MGQAAGMPRTNTIAVTGLVLCILGSCCSPLSLVGLVLCVIGLTQIQKAPQLYTTGKIIPIVGIVVAIVDIILVGIAIYSGAFSEALRNFPR
jgi:hypothetical protein